MKTKSQKREEAMIRFAESKWENSKACRTGSRTKEQWTKWKTERLKSSKSPKKNHS